MGIGWMGKYEQGRIKPFIMEDRSKVMDIGYDLDAPMIKLGIYSLIFPSNIHNNIIQKYEGGSDPRDPYEQLHSPPSPKK